MRKIIFLFFLAIGSASFAQDKFSFTCEEGLNRYIITNLEDKPKNIIYGKTLEWIKKNYKAPDKVISSTVENDYIRFEGISNSFDCNKFLGSIVCSTIKYQIEISIKDNKYKMEILKIENFNNGQWEDYSSYYSPKNKRFFNKDCKVSSRFSQTIDYAPNFLNKLNNGIKNTILGTDKSDDW